MNNSKFIMASKNAKKLSILNLPLPGSCMKHNVFNEGTFWSGLTHSLWKAIQEP